MKNDRIAEFKHSLKSIAFATVKIAIERAEEKHHKQAYTNINKNSFGQRSYKEQEIQDIEYTEIKETKKQTMENQTQVKKKSFFGKVSENISNKVAVVQKESENFMMQNLIDTVMPMLRRLLPKAKQDLHTYMSTVDNEKIIIIKTDSNNDISITVMKKDAIEINLKNQDQYETVEQAKQAYKDSVVDIWSLDNVVEKLVTGKIETIVNNDKE